MHAGEPGYRFVLVGRALYLGALWGAVFGEAFYGVLVAGAAVKDGLPVLAGIVWAPVAGIVGAAVGGFIALVSGLALALSARGVLERISRARLVTGGAAAAVPLAVMVNLHTYRSLVDYLSAAGIATAAVVAAVLVTPRMLYGPPPPGKWQPGIRRAPQATEIRSEQ